MAIDCKYRHYLELLNSMFPNIQWEAEGKGFKQIISTNPPSR